MKKKEALEKLCLLFRDKGYRRQFQLNVNKTLIADSLSGCLAEFFRLHEASDFTDGICHLITFAPYNDHITCDLKMKYDEQRGFLIKEFLVTNLKTDDSKNFRLRNNNELPGSMTLESLFPKPKPWDGIKKGKFSQ